MNVCFCNSCYISVVVQPDHLHSPFMPDAKRNRWTRPDVRGLQKVQCSMPNVYFRNSCTNSFSSDYRYFLPTMARQSQMKYSLNFECALPYELKIIICPSIFCHFHFIFFHFWNLKRNKTAVPRSVFEKRTLGLRSCIKMPTVFVKTFHFIAYDDDILIIFSFYVYLL